MYKIFSILTIGLLFSNCTSYQNKPRYEVAVGETVEIYYSTNSSGYYCITNEGQLKHVSLIKNEMIKPAPDNCAGCNTRSVYIFKANTIGIDTVKLNLLLATDTCTNKEVTLENYIIDVK